MGMKIYNNDKIPPSIIEPISIDSEGYLYYNNVRVYPPASIIVNERCYLLIEQNANIRSGFCITLIQKQGTSEQIKTFYVAKWW